MDLNKTYDSIDEMIDDGFIQSMERMMPNGMWDECGFYRVTFSDGTERDFYDSNEILRFADYLLQFLGDKK